MEARRAQDGRLLKQERQGNNSLMLRLGRPQPDDDHPKKRRFEIPPFKMKPPKVEQACGQEDARRATVVQLAQPLESQKRRAEALLQERDKLEKDRDSRPGMCSKALASMKALEAEMEIEKRKRGEEGAKVELSQAQLGALGGLLLQKNSELATLRMQLAYMEKAKRDGLVEKQQQARDAASAMELLKKEVDGKVSALSSLQVGILEMVSALTADVKAFQGVLRNTAQKITATDDESTVPVSRTSSDEDHAHAECPQPSSSKLASASGAQEKQGGWWKLEPVAENLFKEIESVRLAMNQAAKDWNQGAQKTSQPAPAAQIKRELAGKRGRSFDVGAGEDPQSKEELVASKKAKSGAPPVAPQQSVPTVGTPAAACERGGPVAGMCGCPHPWWPPWGQCAPATQGPWIQVHVSIPSAAPPAPVFTAGPPASAKEDRRACRHKWKLQGLKRRKVRVTSDGTIDSSCEGKSHWDRELRLVVPRRLNVAFVSVKDQNPREMANLRAYMEAKYEFVGPSLSDAGFNECVQQQLDVERARLKELYCGPRKQRTRPATTNSKAWRKLKSAWEEENRCGRGRRAKAGAHAEAVSPPPPPLVVSTPPSTVRRQRGTAALELQGLPRALIHRLRSNRNQIC